MKNIFIYLKFTDLVPDGSGNAYNVELDCNKEKYCKRINGKLLSGKYEYKNIIISN